MVDSTDTHPFTFGCCHVPTVDAGDATVENADDATGSEDMTLLTDGGTVAARTCPVCEGDLANVQGVPTCTQCAWNAH